MDTDEEPGHAPPCNEESIDENAFSVLDEILNRIRKDGGRFSAQEEWFESVCPPPSAPLRHGYNSSKRAIIARTSEVRDDLVLVSRTLGQLFRRISYQAKAIDGHLNTLKLESGLSSLPDEILSLALEEATYDMRSSRKTVKAATKLSHTCRRFRHLVLRSPRLWNRIDDTMHLAMVSFCCDRLAVANAKISLGEVTIYDSGPTPCPFPDFNRITANRSKFWREYSHHFSWPRKHQDLERLAKATRHLDVPELRKLFVRYNRFDNAVDTERQETLNYFQTWSMPRLSALKVQNFIPVPFTNSKSLRALEIEISMMGNIDNRLDLRPLTSFLAACEALESVNLEWHSISDVFETRTHQRVGLDRVTNAKLSLSFCDDNFLTAFFEAVSFPAVHKLKMSILSKQQTDHPGGPVDNTLAIIFPDTSAFPSLLDLELGFEITRRPTRVQVSVPFSALRSVRNLTIASYSSYLAPVPDGRLLPSLESLHTRGCEMLEVDWIASFLGRIIDQGNLQPSRFTSVKCSWARYLEDTTEQTRRRREKYITADEMLQLAMRTLAA